MYQSTRMIQHGGNLWNILQVHKDICLVFYIKDHHLYPIQDDRLKQIATQANQGGADNLWRYMSELKWSNKSSNYIVYEEPQHEKANLS